MRITLSGVLVAACVELSAASAFAEASSQEKAMASQLFDDAERLFAAGKFADACPKYAESNRVDPQLGSLLHLGECYALLGKTASAWASFKDALETAVARSDPRETRIRHRIAELEGHLPKLVLNVPDSAPADLEVKQDGGVVGRPLWGNPVPVDPGPHTVTAAASGRKSRTITVEVPTDGSTVRVAIPELEPEANKSAIVAATPRKSEPATPPTPEAPSSGSPGTTQRILGWSAVGAGAIGLGVGIAYEVVRGNTVSQRDSLCNPQCNDSGEAEKVASLTSQAKTAATVGIVGLVAGGVLVAGGLTLVFTAPGGTESRVAAVPLLAPGFVGGALSGRVW